MNNSDGGLPRASRRGLLTGAGGLFALTAASATAAERPAAAASSTVASGVAFWGERQAGITTPQQSYTYFMTFDLTTGKPGEVTDLLRDVLDPRRRRGLTAGQTAAAFGPWTLEVPAADSADALGLNPARLTLTFGFGAGLFSKDGVDRYGLSARRPEALIELPRFNGDQLVPAATGGDLSVQACADDPQVAFHAVRQLAARAYGVADVRWAQSGFLSKPADGSTPRNLMGFKDGTQQPTAMEQFVWVGDEGPAWMRGGSYLVARRIRLALEHWDRTNVGFQEQTMGRHKHSGAPLGLQHEKEPLQLDRTDKDGNPVIAEGAHVRLANSRTNDGAEILRRGYSYNDGVNFTAERWPPWRQGMEYDAGLFFLAYQRDPRTSFVRIFEKMAKFDMLNQYATHVGGGLFVCPPGARSGEFIWPEAVCRLIAVGALPNTSRRRTAEPNLPLSQIVPTRLRRRPRWPGGVAPVGSLLRQCDPTRANRRRTTSAARPASDRPWRSSFPGIDRRQAKRGIDTLAGRPLLHQHVAFGVASHPEPGQGRETGGPGGGEQAVSAAYLG